MRLISVVLPVYNESESIGPCLRGLASALASEDHEILVCYDTEEDTTLAAIAAMSDRSPRVALVRNRYGRGALNAIRTGFEAARGDVVVTSMADLSDPPAVILEMAKAIRSGADVVSGSRYMRGGSQQGGPLLKRTLSRIAGVSLRWIAGIGTSDATSNFRGYSRAFLDTVTIESRGGFEIALELTVKAHLAGRVVTEVPSSWVDRSAGTSNFRLWRWMPSYLRWYLRAAAEPGLVLGVWLAMLLSAVHLVAAYASTVPYMDDFSIVEGLSRRKRGWLEWLWIQHNEHRIPIAKLVGSVAVVLARDFRAPMYLQVGALAAAALVLIVAARRIRGRTTAADAFFPLILLNWGHYENVLCAFQLALVLPAAVVAAILALIAAGPPAPDRRMATLIGVGLVVLPLSSAAGLLLALPLLLWSGLAGAAAWRSHDPRRRDTGARLLLGAAAAAILAALYFAGFVVPHRNRPPADPMSVLSHVIDMLAMGAAPPVGEPQAVVRWLVAALALATLAVGISRWRAHPETFWRELGLLACGAGFLALGAAIGLGRGEGSTVAAAPRYVTLFTPFWVLLYLVWCRSGSALAGRLVQAGMCLGIAALIPGSMDVARTYAQGRLRDAEILTREVDAGGFPEVIAERRWRSFSGDEDRFANELEQLRLLGLPPYRTAAPGPKVDPRITRPFSLWKAQPVEIHSDPPPVRRRILGLRAVLVRAPTELAFDVPAGARVLRIGFGIDPLLYAKLHASTAGIRFAVERSTETGAREVLFERALDPVDRPEDRGVQEVDVALPPGMKGRVHLCIAGTGHGDPARDWGFWTGAAFDPEPPGAGVSR